MKEGTLASYIIGFVASIALTLAAFFVVLRPGFFNFTSGEVVTTILVLALLQLIIQLVSFLHLGFGSGSRTKTAIFIFTLGLVLLIVIGSLWIMNHLNYNMTPAQMNQYMQDQSTF